MPDLSGGPGLPSPLRPAAGPGRPPRAGIRYGVLVAGVAVALLTGAPAYAADALPAVDDKRGTPGYCPGDEGTTVVVDFRDLGGETLIRCAPGGAERTGLEALQDAGFEVEGVQSYDNMMCRIEGRPAPDESLELDGRKGYQEACVEMPPATAYWSYWKADNGGDWAYSRKGMRDGKAIDGGFEGWSFSLNGASGAKSTPRIDPVRPESGDADEAPTSGVQDGVRWSGGEQAAEPEAAGDDASDSPAPAIAAAGAIGLLAVLIIVTALRRRSRRT